MPHTVKLTKQHIEECRNVKRLFEVERDRSGMTQAHLAKMVGKSPKTVSAIVNARMRVTVDLARDFARVFGVPIADILPWTSSIQSQSEFSDIIASLDELSEENRAIARRMIQNLLDSQ